MTKGFPPHRPGVSATGGILPLPEGRQEYNTMYLGTISVQDDKRLRPKRVLPPTDPFFGLGSLTTHDIEQAAPKIQTRPLSRADTKPGLPKEFLFDAEEQVERSRPRGFVTTRHTNPLEPEYTLASGPEPAFLRGSDSPPPKFLRDTLNLNDLPGTRPSCNLLYRDRPGPFETATLNVTDINGPRRYSARGPRPAPEPIEGSTSRRWIHERKDTSAVSLSLKSDDIAVPKYRRKHAATTSMDNPSQPENVEPRILAKARPSGVDNNDPWRPSRDTRMLEMNAEKRSLQVRIADFKALVNSNAATLPPPPPQQQQQQVPRSRPASARPGMFVPPLVEQRASGFVRIQKNDDIREVRMLG